MVDARARRQIVVNAGGSAHGHPALNAARSPSADVCALSPLVAAINILLLNMPWTPGSASSPLPACSLPTHLDEVEVALRESLNSAGYIVMVCGCSASDGQPARAVRQEYFHYFGARQKSSRKPIFGIASDEVRGVESASIVADGAQSLIREQVEMGTRIGGAQQPAERCVLTVTHPTSYTRLVDPSKFNLWRLIVWLNPWNKARYQHRRHPKRCINCGGKIVAQRDRPLHLLSAKPAPPLALLLPSQTGHRGGNVATIAQQRSGATSRSTPRYVSAVINIHQCWH